MKPTWGIRKLNEYSISKDTAIIITDSEKDNYYWADIPDGSLLVNEKTGNLSIKLTDESDWVPMGIRKDGTDKLVKDAVINVEYYTIVKFELEHNRFYYHDREEITRIGKLIDGKAQFKVGSGLYIPGTNQLEVLINDTIRCNTLDDSLEEINMKYFQIDADDIRLGSTVTVRYINYERLSELYPFIFTQEQYPWFFEDKDIWINTAENVSEDGLAITPMSYTVSYPADDPAHANITVFTTKKAHLIATHRQEEYYNGTTKRSITKFKVPRKTNDYYLNLFSTYFGYQTNYSKALIKGTQTETDKLTLDAEILYPSSLMARASVKTQIGNTVTFKRDGKKLYASQNIGMGVQYNLPREENPYDITIVVKNPSNGLSKEATLTVDRRKIILTADIEHVTTEAGTNVIVTTIPGSNIKIEEVNLTGLTVIANGTSDSIGKYNFTVPVGSEKKKYKVTVSNTNAENVIEDEFEVLLHTGNPKLSASHTRNKNDIKLNVRSEQGSSIIVKYNNNTLFTGIADALNEVTFDLETDYEKDRTFIIESSKENKIFEKINYTIPKYEKYVPDVRLSLRQVPSDFINSTETFRYNGSILDVISEPGSLITVLNEDGSVYTDKFNSNGINNIPVEKFNFHFFNTLSNLDQDKRYAFVPQRRLDKTYKLKSIKKGKIDEEVTFTIQGTGKKEYEIESRDITYVLNPYLDIYENSDSYRSVFIKIKKYDEFSEPSTYAPKKIQLKDDPDSLIIYKESGEEYINDSSLYGGPSAYSGYFNEVNGTYKINQKYLDHINNLKSGNNTFGTGFPIKVKSIDELISSKKYTFVIDDNLEYEFTYSPVMLHYKNIDVLLHEVSTVRKEESEYKDIITNIGKKGYNSNTYIGNPEKVTTYSLDSNVKVIHPSIIKHVSILANQNIPAVEKDILVSKLKEKNYIFNNDQFYSRNDYTVFGNKKLTRAPEIYNNLQVLKIDNRIELIPMNFQYEYASIELKANKKYECYPSLNLYTPNFVFDIRDFHEDSKQIQVPIKTKRNKVVFDTLKELGYSLNSYSKDDENQINIGTKNLIILSNRETIPSYYFNNIDNLNINGVYYLPKAKNIQDNALSMSLETFGYFNYPLFKQLGNDCFYNLYYNNGYRDSIFLNCMNLDDSSNEILIDNSNYQILSKRSPFPSAGQYNGRFKLKIVADTWYPSITNIADEDKKIINKFIFVLSGIEEIIYNGNDLCFTYPVLNGKVTSQNFGAAIKYDHIDQTKYKTNAKYSYSAKFYKCSYLKNLNLDYFKNYFVDHKDFLETRNLEKIIMPKNYLVKGSTLRAFEYCGAKEIENLDNVLVCNTELSSTFKGCENLTSDINMNYLTYIDSYTLEKCKKLSNFVYRKSNINMDCEGNVVSLDNGCLEAGERGIKNIQNNYAYYNDTVITQESFDRIKKHMKKMTRNQFSNCTNITKLILDNDCPIVYFLNAFNTPLKKILIDSNTIDYIEFNDRMFSDSDLITDPNAYRINSDSLRIFNGGDNSLGLYSSIHSINAPNLKYSFVANKSKLLGVYNVENFNNRSLFTKHIPDTAKLNTGVTYSVFNKAESEAAIQNEELHLLSNAFASNFFDESIDRNDIKIKKLIYTNADNYISQYNGIIWSDNTFLDDSKIKKWIEQIRWPALEEIEVKTGIFYPEKTVLGVKIKYVKA